MTSARIKLQPVLLRAYRLLKTKDEFGAARLVGALLLLGQHFPLEMQHVPQQVWEQSAGTYLEELLLTLMAQETAVNADEPSLLQQALSGFSFRQPLSGTPPAADWSETVAELCAVMAPIWSAGSEATGNWGQVLLAVLLGRPAFVRAFAPTPPAAAQLAAQLLRVEPGHQVLDLQCRLGQVLLALLGEGHGDQVLLWGNGHDPQAVSLSALLLLSGTPNARVTQIPLSADAPLLGFTERCFDRVVAHPPLEAAVGQARQYVEELVIEQVLGTLRPDGRAVVIVSGGYLHRQRPDPVIRRRLVTEDWLRAVIQLPGTTKDPGGPPSLLVLENTRANEAVLFLDLSEGELAEWLQPEAVSSLIEATNGRFDERSSTLLTSAQGEGSRPRGKTVSRADIAPDADLSLARYLISEETAPMTPAVVLEAKRQYQLAWKGLGGTTQKFDQLMDDLFKSRATS